MTTIRVSLFAITLGAILKFAVTAQAAGIDLATVGVILMVVGGIGLCVGLWLYLADRESADRAWRRRVQR
jgi:Flp pilus assembly protein protease CpaA